MQPQAGVLDEHDPVFGHTGVLRLVLDFVGPGEHLFISTCRSWRWHYQLQLRSRTNKQGDGIDPCSTTYKAVFEGCHRLQLPADSGFAPLLSKCEVHRSAGRWASIEALQLAERHDLRSGNEILYGALQSGCLRKVQWLSSGGLLDWQEHHFFCAALSGSVEVAQWLATQGCTAGESAI